MFIKNIKKINLLNKRVLIRSDLNVPMKNGKISSYARIISSLSTIRYALDKGAYVMVMSHLGRPKKEKYSSKLSLKPIVDFIKKKIPYPVFLVKKYLKGIKLLKKTLFVLENVRFNKGEKENKESLSKQYANLCDIFIMDAFGSSHLIQASTYGIGKFSSIVCFGFLLNREIKYLERALHNPSRPMISIVGGSKVSSKLKTLKSLLEISDFLVVGGGIANTFIAAQGYNVGSSLYEPNLISESKKLLKNPNIFVPKDVRISKKFKNYSFSISQKKNKIQNNESILDIGDSSIDLLTKILESAKTILWNGPVGMFELNDFKKGTEFIANCIAESNAFSIVGGGETISAIDLFNVRKKISYISTGGGAFLKFVEKKTLPISKILKKKL